MDYTCHYDSPLGGITLARRIYEDIRGLKGRVEGFIEDGSQRSFFPNGFAYYTYAEIQRDTTLSFDEIKEIMVANNHPSKNREPAFGKTI